MENTTNKNIKTLETTTKETTIERNTIACNELLEDLQAIFANDTYNFMVQANKRRIIVKKGASRVAIVYLNNKVLTNIKYIGVFKDSDMERLEMLQCETKNKDASLQFYYETIEDLEPLTSL